MSDFYHTAMRPAESDAPPRDWWIGGGCMAFTHDVSSGLPKEFADVDVIYAELPWADGFEEFQTRAGVIIPTPYNEWLFALSGHLFLSGKPYVIVAGHAASRHMAYEWSRPVNLNGSVALAMGARLPVVPDEVRDAEALVQTLTSAPFGIVGDPCAGYGRTARIFAEAGKKFYAADINAKCIGHIAREAPTWLSATT